MLVFKYYILDLARFDSAFLLEQERMAGKRGLIPKVIPQKSQKLIPGANPFGFWPHVEEPSGLKRIFNARCSISRGRTGYHILK